ncbi:MAG: hypothetical protein ACOH10_11670 [Rhodoglobus sp.]
MRIIPERLAVLATLVIIALAVSQGVPSSVVVAGITAVLLIAAVRGAAIVIGSRELIVGARARAHREAMFGMPAPRHPSTAGLPLTRAPSLGFAA